MEALAVLAAITMAMEARLEADLRCLPPPEMVSQSIAFYNAHAAWLHTDELVCQNRQIVRWRVENSSYGFVWNLLSEAQDRSKPLNKRQNAIANLKRRANAGLLPWPDASAPNLALQRRPAK